jgi:hypothetical protein
MSISLRSLGVLVLAVMVLAAATGDGQAQGKRRTTFDGVSVVANPIVQPQLRLGQLAYNTALLGSVTRQIPPYALGLNPFGRTGFGFPTVPTLSTLGGGGTPFLGGSTLATSPYGGFGGGNYSLSTTPGLDGAANTPYGGGYGGYGTYIPPEGFALMGLAQLTSAQGKYWGDIQQARLLREQSIQLSFETAKKRVELERWYESMKLTAPQMREREMATDLDRARKDPPATEVWSGKSLNELLRSIQNLGPLNRGPAIALDEDTLKSINLSGGTRGNIGMLRDEGKLNWPLPLQEAQFSELRDRLAKNIRHAVSDLKNKEPLPSATLRDITLDFKALNDKLSDSADDLSPGQYIEAKRFLNQLAQAVRALSDPKVVNYFNNTWNAKGKTVAELVANMTKEGLVFAPAAPGDEPAYTSLYQSLRQFEAGMQQSQK